jgi:hypothetical protein
VIAPAALPGRDVGGSAARLPAPASPCRRPRRPAARRARWAGRAAMPRPSARLSSASARATAAPQARPHGA